MELAKNSLMISYITGGQQHDTFNMSLWSFRQYDQSHKQLWDQFPCAVRGYCHASNRNAAVRVCKDSDKEALLFIDTDISFSSSAIYTLVDALDPLKCPVVTGFYCGRPGSAGVWYQPPLRPIWYDYSPSIGFTPIERFEGGDAVQRLGGCGMGFCLIHRSVFNTFPVINTPKGEDPWRWFGRDLEITADGLDRISEDLTFCLRAHNLGIPIYGHCGTANMIKHSKDHLETFETWMLEESYRKVLQKGK